MVHHCQHIRNVANPNRKDESGSAILAALAVVVALVLISAFALTFSKDKYSSTSQASSYQESLYAAEGGIDIARTALRTALSDPTTAWSGWTPSDGTFPKTRTYTLPVLDPGTTVDVSRPWGSKIVITISLPTGAGTINPVNTSGYSYKVTSVGTVGVSGTTQVTQDSNESRLHRVSYQTDWRNNTAVSSPEVSRKVEAILKPVSPFVAAVLADDNIEIKKGKTEVVDSFNSDMGKYDPTKRLTTFTGSPPNIANAGWNGTLATNAKKSDVIRVENATIYGDLYKNTGGTANIKSTATVTGIVHDGFYMDLKQAPSPRTNPDWSSYTTISILKPGSKNQTITASSSSTAPARFKFTQYHQHSGDILTIKSPSNGASESWVEIWCADSLRLHKGGNVIIEQGVHVKFFCEKCIHLESKDGKAAVVRYQNQNPTPQTFVPVTSGGVTARQNFYAEFYGVLPDAKKESHLKISGQFAGLVHAPRHEVECKLNDSANNDIYASFIVRKFKMQGVTQVHYDEYMGNLGAVTDYAISNWNEDWTDKKIAGP